MNNKKIIYLLITLTFCFTIFSRSFAMSSSDINNICIKTNSLKSEVEEKLNNAFSNIINREEKIKLDINNNRKIIDQRVNESFNQRDKKTEILLKNLEKKINDPLQKKALEEFKNEIEVIKIQKRENEADLARKTRNDIDNLIINRINEINQVKINTELNINSIFDGTGINCLKGNFKNTSKKEVLNKLKNEHKILLENVKKNNFKEQLQAIKDDYQSNVSKIQTIYKEKSTESLNKLKTQLSNY